MRTAPSFLALLAVVLAPALAGAQAPEPAAGAQAPGPAAARPATVAVQLELVLGPGAERCPGEAMLRQEVARRIGYDPFAADAKGIPAGRVRAVIAGSPQGLTATFEYVDAAGVHQWTRTYVEPGTSTRSCTGVLQGIAVELAGELVLINQPEPPPESPEPAPPPPEPALAAPPATMPALPPSSTSPRPRFELGAGTFIGGGTASGVTAGGVLHAGLVLAAAGHDRTRLLVAVEGRVDTPATDKHGIQTQMFAGSVVACGNRDLIPGLTVTWGFLGCVLGTVGVVHGSWGGLDRPMSSGSAYAAVGGRLGWEARIASVVALRAQIEALPAIHRARVLGLDRGASAGTGSVAGNAGLAVVFPL